MSLIVHSLFFPSIRKWLTRTRASPTRSIIWPSGELQGERPAGDSGKEMHLSKPGNIAWLNITDTPFVYRAGRDELFADEVPQPPRGELVVFVVEAAHTFSAAACRLPVRLLRCSAFRWCGFRLAVLHRCVFARLHPAPFGLLSHPHASCQPFGFHRSAFDDPLRLLIRDFTSAMAAEALAFQDGLTILFRNVRRVDREEH